MVKQKKAISPVVATALLLVVAVVAVVGFQSWFTTYQSGINTKVEQQSNAGSALTIERLEGTSSVSYYVKNSATEAVQVNSVKIMNDGTLKCQNTTAFNATASSVTEGSLDCSSNNLTTASAYDVVLVTDNGVYTSTQIAR